jgi:hypothetical protein
MGRAGLGSRVEPRKKLDRIATAFERFCRVAKGEALGAFVIELLGESPESLVGTIHSCLQRLGGDECDRMPWLSAAGSSVGRLRMHGLEFAVSCTNSGPDRAHLLLRPLNARRVELESGEDPLVHTSFD